MTKTCLDVLKQLGQSFSSAMEASGKGPTRKVAPYVLKNETGLAMILDLEHSLFKVRHSEGPFELSFLFIHSSIYLMQFCELVLVLTLDIRRWIENTE